MKAYCTNTNCYYLDYFDSMVDGSGLAETWSQRRWSTSERCRLQNHGPTGRVGHRQDHGVALVNGDFGMFHVEH